MLGGRAAGLVAGDNVADRSLSEPQVLDRARHRRIDRRFDDPELKPDVYQAHLSLPTPVRDATITFHGAPTGGWWAVDRLTLTQADGTALPQSLADVYLGDPRRWREVSRIKTSRHTDRDREETAPDEFEYTVYENLRALPRAWITSEVMALDERDMLATVHTMQLPDGRRFDPRQLALVDPGPGHEPHRFDVAPSSVAVTQIDDGRIALDVSAPAGGYLVLSESYFPGWRARIGDSVIPVTRTDLALQRLPRHRGHTSAPFNRSKRLARALSPAAFTSGQGRSIGGRHSWTRAWDEGEQRYTVRAQTSTNLSEKGLETAARSRRFALTGSSQIPYYSVLKATLWHTTPTRVLATADLFFRGTYVRYGLSSTSTLSALPGKV